MKVNLSFFAVHKRTAGTDKASIELPDGSSARDAAHAAETQFGLVLKGSMVAINDEYAEPERKLEPGDTVAFIPPVAGGSSSDFFQITPNALEILELH